MRTCHHETAWKVLCSSFLRCRYFIYFLRPPIGRSVKYTQKQKRRRKMHESCITDHHNLLFLLPKKNTIPIQLSLMFRNLVQLERITFRADLDYFSICSFHCSESDTFLKNYTIPFHNRGNFHFQGFLPTLWLYGTGVKNVP